MFNWAIIDNETGGVCDRFESIEEARKAYPDNVAFDVEFYTDEENAEIDSVFMD